MFPRFRMAPPTLPPTGILISSRPWAWYLQVLVETIRTGDMSTLSWVGGESRRPSSDLGPLSVLAVGSFGAELCMGGEGGGVVYLVGLEVSISKFKALPD